MTKHPTDPPTGPIGWDETPPVIRKPRKPRKPRRVARPGKELAALMPRIRGTIAFIRKPGPVDADVAEVISGYARRLLIVGVPPEFSGPDEPALILLLNALACLPRNRDCTTIRAIGLLVDIGMNV